MEEEINGRRHTKKTKKKKKKRKETIAITRTENTQKRKIRRKKGKGWRKTLKEGGILRKGKKIAERE